MKNNMDWNSYFSNFVLIPGDEEVYINETGQFRVIYHLQKEREIDGKTIPKGLIIEISTKDFAVKYGAQDIGIDDKEKIKSFVVSALSDVTQHERKIVKMFKKERARQITKGLFREFAIE